MTYVEYLPAPQLHFSYPAEHMPDTHLAQSIRNCKISDKTLINYQKRAESELKSSSYVYLGSQRQGVNIHCGATLDEQGQLVLIKGKSKGFIKTILSKIKGRTTFYDTLTLNTRHVKFKDLYLDSKGQLIGVDSHNNSRSIFIDAINTPSHDGKLIFKNIKTSITSPLIKNRASTALEFDTDDNRKMVFTCVDKNSRRALNLTIINKDDENREPRSNLSGELTLPLPKGMTLLSIKRHHELLQLECGKANGKTKVLYLNPAAISIAMKDHRHHLKADYLSHKPSLQNLYSLTGKSPYEKVTSGQPFDSRRMANAGWFYSPIFSSYIDGVRTGIKKASRQHGLDAHLTRARAIDPFFTDAFKSCKSAAVAIKKLATRHDYQDVKAKYFAKTNSLLNKPEISNLVGSTDKLISRIKELHQGDSISLIESKATSGFVGVAAPGPVTEKGWFAGIVLGLSKSKGLTISKEDVDEKGNYSYKISMNRENKKSASPMAGIGQGLEQHIAKVGNAGGSLSWLPIEALFILSMSHETTSNLSFNIDSEHMDEFVKMLFDKKTLTKAEQSYLKNSSLAKKTTNRADVIFEAKVELRTQQGAPLPPHYMIAPRFAVGASYTPSIGVTLERMSTTDLSSPDKSAPPKKTGKLSWHVNPLAGGLYYERKPAMLIAATGDHLMPFPVHEKKDTLPIPAHITDKLNLERPLTLDNQHLRPATDKIINAEIQARTMLAELEAIIKEGKTFDYHPDDIKKMSFTRTLKLKSQPDSPLVTRWAKSRTADNSSTILNDIRDYAHRIERNSGNKYAAMKMKAHYSLDHSPADAERHLNRIVAFAQKLDELPQDNKSDSITGLLSSIKELHHDIHQKKYRLDSLTYYADGLVKESNTSLSLSVINRSVDYSLLHTKKLGEITFKYNDHQSSSPSGMTSTLAVI